MEGKKNLGGRPRKFESAEELQQKIDEYFNSCIMPVVEKDKDGKTIYDEDGNPVIEYKQIAPYTITGLALALDTSRETLMDVENHYPKEFSDAIKRAKLRCHNYAEQQMFVSRNAAGAIFALKNYGWKDKQEVDQNINAEIKIKLEGDLSDWSK